MFSAHFFLSSHSGTHLMWMIIYLISYQRSLNQSPLLFILLFFIFFWQHHWFPLFCLTTDWSISLYHSAYHWFFLVYFSFQLLDSLFFSYWTLHLWFFFIFSNSLLKTSNLPLWASILLPGSLIIFMIATLNPFLGKLPILISFSPFPGVLSFFFVWNCHFILPKLLFVLLCIWYFGCISKLWKSAFVGDILCMQ